MEKTYKIDYDKKKIELSFWGKVQYYLPAFLLFAIGLFFICDSLDVGIFNVSFLVVGLVTAIFLYKALFFKILNINASKKEIEEAVERTCKESGWMVVDKEVGNHYQLGRYGFSSETMITIIKHYDKVWISSVDHLERMRFSFFSFYWNKKNITAFTKNLNDVKNSIPEKIIIEKTENEFGFKRMFIRGIMYLFYLSLFLVMIISFIKKPNVGSVVIFIVLLGFARIFILPDFILMKSQMNKEKKKNNF